MHSKRSSHVKSFAAAIRRLFRARNIIIISEHKVDHVPLSGTMQVLVLTFAMVLLCGVSYISGSYMTARATIREKDEKIASGSIERNRITEEVDSLKSDLMRLSENSKDLNEYTKFMIDEHLAASTDGADAAAFSANFTAGNLFGQGDQHQSERIAYLENRLQEVRHDIRRKRAVRA